MRGDVVFVRLKLTFAFVEERQCKMTYKLSYGDASLWHPYLIIDTRYDHFLSED